MEALVRDYDSCGLIYIYTHTNTYTHVLAHCSDSMAPPPFLSRVGIATFQEQDKQDLSQAPFLLWCARVTVTWAAHLLASPRISWAAHLPSSVLCSAPLSQF